ncbi:CPBP family intramembrane glutamic endopeptidase [Nonlabens agnitus]|uniref:CAAX protease family protein n=1 Tax=Nonlabens agnitus TaxID=870484 RepID=A0A2S9WRI2_9FLAO|nr:CPBP family intramembrane glutamic endopeptidase [Nonlabens agnitus]PRP66094.1 CAAX protease family protein [Nonlabens agnitus]
MYIEQGYKGSLGTWNFFVIPVLFMLLMGFNYVSTVMLLEESDQSMEQMMAQMIDVMGRNVFLAVNLMIFVVGLLGIFIWVKFINQQSLTSLTTSRKRIDWKRIFFMFGFWAAFSAGSILLSVYLAPENYELQFDWNRFLPLLIISLVLFPFQTSFEEYLFRGQLLQGLGIATKSRAVAWIVTSVLFGLMHAANPEVEKLGFSVMIFYIGTGLVLGAMTLLDEGLELALGFHAANNITAALMMTASWTAIQTDSIYIDVSEPTAFTLVDMIPIFVGYPILLLILGRIYKWKNWKEKLFGRVQNRAYFTQQNPELDTNINNEL